LQRVKMAMSFVLKILCNFNNILMSNFMQMNINKKFFTNYYDIREESSRKKLQHKDFTTITYNYMK
jgi:hypothetical protein